MTLNVGPELAAVMMSLIAAVGAWLTYLQGRAIKKEVNSSASRLAVIATEREAKVVALERENAELRAKGPGGS